MHAPGAGQIDDYHLDHGPDLEYQHFSDSQVEINTGRYQSSDCLSIEMSLSINSLSNTFLQLDLMKVAREELSESMPVRVRDQLDICFQQQALPMVLQRNTGEHLQFQEENQSRTLQDEKLQESHEEPDLEYRNPSQDLELKYYKVKVWRLLSRVMELLERKKLIVKQDLVEKFSDPGCSSKRNGKNYQPISPASFSKQKSSDCTARPITYTMNEVLPMQEPHSPKFSHVEFTQSTLDSRCNRSRDKSSPSERNTAASQYKGSSPSRPQRLNYEDAENVKPKKSSPKGVSHQGQIKTELCKNWQENGDCPYSMHCRFAHGVEELRPVIRHPLYKTQICRMLLEGKVCIYGHRCHFRHALTDEEISMILHLNNGST